MTKQIIGNNSRKIISLFLIQLMLVLTLNAPIVFASIGNIEAHGQDNVNDFIRTEDFITFKATAAIAGDDSISNNQVLLGSNQEFDSCQTAINGFTCQLRFPADGTSTFDAKAIPYTVTLKNDEGIVIDTETSNIYVDNLPPELKSFSIDQALISSGTVRLSYEVEDRSCSVPSCAGQCSGISRIELSDVNSNFQEIITLNTESCSVSDTFDVASIVFAEGSHTITAKAFDKFDQISPGASAAFILDKSAPFIDLNSFSITDETNLDLAHFGPVPTIITVKVNIKDSDLDKNKVFADLDQIEKNSNLQNVQAACGETEDDITTCSWQVTLNPDGPGLKEFTIKATDKSGNEGKTIISKNLALDNKGPVVLSLVSSNILDGKNFAKLQGNTFTATLNDEAGIKPSNIILHAPNLAREADSCTKVVDLWECTWNGVDFNRGGKINVFIDTDSKDRVGNNVASKFSKEVIVDDGKPRLVEIVVQGIGGVQENLQDFIITGDKIQVQAVVEDESLSSAVADFSAFIFDSDEVPADTCTSTGDNVVVCSWTTPSIDIDGFIDSVVSFEFTDIAGNTLTHSEPLEVLGTISGATSDFWKSSVQCSPTVLDRETLPLINQRAFCMISLEKKSVTGQDFQNIEIVSTSLASCDGDTGLIESTELVNTELSQEPVIKINFQKQSPAADELNLACTLDIITRQGNNIVITPEQETVSASFGFYNQPLGELSASTQEKIDDAIEDADGMLSFVTTLNSVVFYATKICTVGGIIGQVIGIFKTWDTIWAKFRTATTGTGISQATAYTHLGTATSAETLRQAGLGTYSKTLSKFCNLVNCKTTVDESGKELKFSFEGEGSILGDWRKGGEGILRTLDVGHLVENYVSRDPNTAKRPDPTSFLNPRDSIVVAALTACIPGVIHGIDKYRQIQCMYADCLQTGVGEQGLPIFACEDQKEYATCKYVVGEIFKVIPITAAFDHYANLIKSVLSNPFKIIGAGIAAACNPGLVVAEPFSYEFCAGTKVISFIGTLVQEVTSIFDSNTWTIHQDFCERLEENDDLSDSGGFS